MYLEHNDTSKNNHEEQVSNMHCARYYDSHVRIEIYKLTNIDSEP
jgi:hypothetical protein